MGQLTFKAYQPGETSVDFQQVSSLLKEAFEERTRQGLHFTCANFSPSEVCERLKGKYLYALYDAQNLVSICAFTVNGRHALLEYVAVTPKHKHGGYATKLFRYAEEKVRDMGIAYLTSTTACGATSSVRWHKKIGFRIYGYASFFDTNYYSYLFRKQLVPSMFWNNALCVKGVFLFYYVGVKIGKKANGELTAIGRMIQILRGG